MPQSTSHPFIVAAFALSVLGVHPTSAQTINEDLKLTASDAADYDLFGASVAISGTTAIVGAKQDEDDGQLSGSAYLFDTVTGFQLFKLTADDATRLDEFGSSVAIFGTTAIVGAPRRDDAGEYSGAAYLFDTETGLQIMKLTASDAAPGDRFGWSVAISGTTAIIGAFFDDDGGSNSGSAYLFDIKSGQQLNKLTADDAAPDDEFGKFVAISGSTAIVGALLDDDAGSKSGSAYLFDTKTGLQTAKLTASDAAAGDRFGRFVAISDTTAIVGANGDDSVTGSAYLFDTQSGLQLFKLTASDATQGDEFGVSVALSGTTAIVGSRHDDDEGLDSGSAYLFDTRSGLQIAKLIASDAETNDQFGLSVAISDNTAIVGSFLDDDDGDFSGSAYLFSTPAPCRADLTGDGRLDFFDVSAFIAAFAARSPIADFAGDGIINWHDVSVFLSDFGIGCR